MHNEAILPASVRFKIRTCTKWAGSEESKRFVPEIQDKMMAYFKDSIKYNTVDPHRGFDLDLTCGEVIRI